MSSLGLPVAATPRVHTHTHHQPRVATRSTRPSTNGEHAERVLVNKQDFKISTIGRPFVRNFGVCFIYCAWSCSANIGPAIAEPPKFGSEFCASSITIPPAAGNGDDDKHAGSRTLLPGMETSPGWFVMLQTGTEQLVLRNLSGWQRSLDKQPKFMVEDPRPYSAARSDRKHLHCTKILDSTCVPFLNRGTTSAPPRRGSNACLAAWPGCHR